MQFTQMISKIRLLFIASLLSLTFSCDKNNQGVIPYVPIEIQININNPSYLNLTAVGGWIYLEGGSLGLIVFRNSNDAFSVFDRHSTYAPENNCQVEIGDNLLKLIDPCSGSEFLITDGSVVKSPASFPLRQYKWEFIAPTLRIYN